MKVCVLYAPQSKGNEKMKAIAKALAEGIGSQGHMVDVLDMTLEAGKIVSYYDYLIIGTESSTFFGGKIPPSVAQFPRGAGPLSGKRCMAFITKGGVRSMKTLQSLMKTMEKEGMFLKKSEILTKVDFARAVGKHIQI